MCSETKEFSSSTSSSRAEKGRDQREEGKMRGCTTTR